MNFEIWWVWMILAAAFVIGEILTAGFFLLWFGIAAAVAGTLALLGVPVAVQIAVFIVASAVLFILGRRFAERVTSKQPPGVGADRLIGKEGVVITRIDNRANTGRVRIGQDEWRATSLMSEPVAEGTRVRVTRLEGSHAVVEVIEEVD